MCKFIHQQLSFICQHGNTWVSKITWFTVYSSQWRCAPWPWTNVHKDTWEIQLLVVRTTQTDCGSTLWEQDTHLDDIENDLDPNADSKYKTNTIHSNYFIAWLLDRWCWCLVPRNTLRCCKFQPWPHFEDCNRSLINAGSCLQCNRLWVKWRKDFHTQAVYVLFPQLGTYFLADKTKGRFKWGNDISNWQPIPH